MEGRTVVGGSGDGDLEIAVDEEAAGELFEVLSSAPARELLGRLQERPSTPPELAAATDHPGEVVGEHLSALEEAGLVEVVATTTDASGTPVEVYGPTDRAVVRYGDDGRSTAAAVATLLVGAVVVVAATWLAWTHFGGWTVGVPFFVGGASVLLGWGLIELGG